MWIRSHVDAFSTMIQTPLLSVHIQETDVVIAYQQNCCWMSASHVP